VRPSPASTESAPFFVKPVASVPTTAFRVVMTAVAGVRLGCHRRPAGVDLVSLGLARTGSDQRQPGLADAEVGAVAARGGRHRALVHEDDDHVRGRVAARLGEGAFEPEGLIVRAAVRALEGEPLPKPAPHARQPGRDHNAQRV